MELPGWFVELTKDMDYLSDRELYELYEKYQAYRNEGYSSYQTRLMLGLCDPE